MHVICKIKHALKYDERKMNRKGIFYAPDFSLAPMNQYAPAKMLRVRIKAHIEEISSLFSLKIGITFNKKSFSQREGARIHVFITHGDNGNKIALLQDYQQELNYIMMQHHSKDAGIDFTHKLQCKELEILVRCCF